MKNLRQKAIVEIISKYEVDTQQRLAELLRQYGFEATQATVSRDIKDMSLIKVSAKNNRYKYALPHIASVHGKMQKFHSVFHDSIISAEVAGNLLVIKTYPGMANAVCAAMDQIGFDGVVGTIAGDDTIFMAICSEAQARAVKQKLFELE